MLDVVVGFVPNDDDDPFEFTSTSLLDFCVAPTNPEKDPKQIQRFLRNSANFGQSSILY